MVKKNVSSSAFPLVAFFFPKEKAIQIKLIICLLKKY